VFEQVLQRAQKAGLQPKEGLAFHAERAKPYRFCGQYGDLSHPSRWIHAALPNKTGEHCMIGRKRGEYLSVHIIRGFPIRIAPTLGRRLFMTAPIITTAAPQSSKRPRENTGQLGGRKVRRISSRCMEPREARKLAGSGY
jgi:hypothetical protein